MYAILSESPRRSFFRTRKSTGDPGIQIPLDSGPMCGTGVCDAIASFSSIKRSGENMTRNREWIRPSKGIALRSSSIGAGHVAGAWDHFGGVHLAVPFTRLIVSSINQNGAKVGFDYQGRMLKTRAAQLQQDIEFEK